MPSNTDYFSLLNLPAGFELDMTELEKAYFTAQRLYHPDRFVGKPTEDRQRALQQSVDTNQAYQTLKTPYSRAKYLLKCQDIRIDKEQGGITPPPALLMETMEWREEIQDSDSNEVLESLENRLQELKSGIIASISTAYDKQNWQTMAEHTMRLGYLLKSQEELQQKRKRLKIQA